MYTALEILNLSTDFLKQKGVKGARKEAEDLLSKVLGINRIELYLQFDRPLTDDEINLSRKWLKQRASGEPLQYIFGKVDFYGCEICIDQRCIIPRQETEILVDKIAKNLSSASSLEGKVLWDVCTGSGCIGIALKKKFPALEVFLSDISEEAICLSRLNAAQNGVDLTVLQGDLLSAFEGKKCDFFVCNPPYISESEYESLEGEVREFEPKLALVSGKTGLEFYERLANCLFPMLNPEAKAWFEIGTGQGGAILQAFQAPCWKRVSVENDWSGHNRFFSLEIE